MIITLVPCPLISIVTVSWLIGSNKEEILDTMSRRIMRVTVVTGWSNIQETQLGYTAPVKIMYDWCQDWVGDTYDGLLRLRLSKCNASIIWFCTNIKHVGIQLFIISTHLHWRRPWISNGYWKTMGQIIWMCSWWWDELWWPWATKIRYEMKYTQPAHISSSYILDHSLIFQTWSRITFIIFLLFFSSKSASSCRI